MKLNRSALKTLIGKKALVGCEVGVLEGLNSLNMLNDLDIKKLYLVDPYLKWGNHNRVSNERDAKENLAQFKDKIVWIKEPSPEASAHIEAGSLDFVYIDGDHSWTGIWSDLKAWYPKLKPGGLFSGHDFMAWTTDDIREKPLSNNGVKRAVIQFCITNNLLHLLRWDPKLLAKKATCMDWWLIKPETAP